MPEDFAALAAAGIVMVINNRPDIEVPPDLSSAEMRKAAEAAGLVYIENPITMSSLGKDVGERQKAAIEQAEGPVHAHCGSGMRSTIAWAIGEAGTRPIDEILVAAAQAGFALDAIRPLLSAEAARQA